MPFSSMMAPSFLPPRPPLTRRLRELLHGDEAMANGDSAEEGCFFVRLTHSEIMALRSFAIYPRKVFSGPCPHCLRGAPLSQTKPKGITVASLHLARVSPFMKEPGTSANSAPEISVPDSSTLIIEVLRKLGLNAAGVLERAAI